MHTVAGADAEDPRRSRRQPGSIKQLGTNGGEFFNVNSAHPFENPTPFSDFLELYAILIIPFALAFTFGRMVKDKRQGYAVFAIMFMHLAGGHPGHGPLRGRRQPEARRRRRDQTVTATSPGGNMEGKEVRFGPTASAIWARRTTGTSNGSVNSMHDSYTPLGGMVPWCT